MIITNYSWCCGWLDCDGRLLVDVGQWFRFGTIPSGAGHQFVFCDIHFVDWYHSDSIHYHCGGFATKGMDLNSTASLMKCLILCILHSTTTDPESRWSHLHVVSQFLCVHHADDLPVSDVLFAIARLHVPIRYRQCHWLGVHDLRGAGDARKEFGQLGNSGEENERLTPVEPTKNV